MKRLTALGAALAGTVILLSACGGVRDEESLLSRASGIRHNAEVMQVAGQPVTAQRYLYWLAEACDAICANCAEAGLEADWSALVGEQTLAEYAAEQARTTAALYAQIEAWANAYDCALTREDRAAIEREWEEAAAEAGGEAALEARLAAMGVDKSFAKELSGDYHLYARLYQLAGTEGSALCPAQEELSTWAEIRELTTAETLFLPAGDSAVDDAGALDEKRATAENLLRQIQLHEHPEEGFAELGALAQAEYSSRTFFPGESGLPASVELAAVSLETGELSGLLETKEGFWLVCKKVLDPKAALAAWFDERLQTEASAAAVEISEELEQLDVERFYKELTRLREELPDAKTLPAQSAQAPSAQLPGDRSGAGSASGSEDSSASAADSSREEKESGSVIILPDGNGQPI